MVEVFNLISQLKNVKKDYLVVGIGTQIYMARMYFKYKAYKKYSFTEWKNSLIMYCIENMMTWKEAIQSLREEKII